MELGIIKRLLNKVREHLSAAECVCGHRFDDHHLMASWDGFYTVAECEYYGSNQWGGKEPTIGGHLFSKEERDAIKEAFGSRETWMATSYREHCRRFRHDSWGNAILERVYRWVAPKVFE